MNVHLDWHLLWQQIAETDWLQWVAVSLGVAEVLFAKANKIWLYPTGLLGTLLSIYILFLAGLFAECLLNGYYVVMSAYGWWYWVKKKDLPPVKITRCNRREWITVAGITGTSFFILAVLLRYFTPSTVPVWDAWVSATAWAGMWLLAKRKIENWILLNISNAFAIPLLLYKQLPLYAALTLFLFIVAVAGYFQWRKIFRNEGPGSSEPPAPHPSHFIPAAAADKICQLSGEAERSGRLHPEQLAIIYEQRWFSLFVPRSYGGLELSLPEGLRTEEGLAWADGSTGWTVTLCSGANWFIGFLSPEIAKNLFSDRRVCFAGSGRAAGTARVTASGYEVTGRWSYASGAPHATAFTANCLIEKDGAILQNEDGSPMVRAFVFQKDEVVVHEDWKAMGMIATASHSFEVIRQSVPADRCFTIDSDHAFLSQPIYQYPFLQLAEATLAVNSSGMAARFMDLCEEVFAKRAASAAPASNAGSASSPNAPAMGTAMRFLGEAKAALQDLRNSFYLAVGASWEEYLEKNLSEQAISEPTLLGRTLSEHSLLDAVSRSSRRLAAGARHLVDELYPWCGLVAANPGTEINRVWRNLHTASQHSLLSLRD